MRGRGLSIIGIREVQRALKLSNASVASYHFEKLTDIGLIEKMYGNYRLKRGESGSPSQLRLLGRFMLPRHFYAVFLTTMLITYVLTYPQVLTIHNVVALLFGAVGSAIQWYITTRIIRQKPF